jgi:rare lipoprotein A
MNALTAAHPELPFGTRLKITSPENGRSVLVRINDRGPFVGGRDLDLSLAAARRLGIEGRGVARVVYERLPE